MAQEISIESDKNGSQGRVKGSDSRLNCSSRNDSRRYYNSRDEGQTYSMAWDFQSAASGEYAAYLQNTSPDKELVVTGIGLNAAVATRFKCSFVTGTASGTSVTPVNLNDTSKSDAAATAVEGASAATGITGLSEAGVIDFIGVVATGHDEFRFDDALRLGQNSAIAIEADETAGGDVWGVIFFYFE